MAITSAFFSRYWFDRPVARYEKQLQRLQNFVHRRRGVRDRNITEMQKIIRQLVPVQRAMLRLKSLVPGNNAIRKEVVDLAWGELEMRYRLRTIQIRMVRGRKVKL